MRQRLFSTPRMRAESSCQTELWVGALISVQSHRQTRNPRREDDASETTSDYASRAQHTTRWCWPQHPHRHTKTTGPPTPVQSSDEGNRYFVSNLPFNRLNDRQWLKALRAYWRVENESNWVADVFWHEDARRTPWTTTPEAIYVMSALRMLAMNIVSALRAMCRQPGLPPSKLPWKIALRDVLMQLMLPRTSLDAVFAGV